MVEELLVPDAATKTEKYEAVIPQIEALMTGETDFYANMANVAAALHQAFGFFWVGFYIVKAGQLVLGPFQGPIACTRIGYGKGVCGTAWKEEGTILVDDVEAFPGHIACNSASKSELVVPLKKGGQVIAVLDLDSDKRADFDRIDVMYLEKLCSLIVNASEIA